jgi:hypothetical protein
MGIKTKIVTMDCNACDHFGTNYDKKITCNWGKGKPKILSRQLGKKPLKCNLIKRNKPLKEAE